jgi:hypothetical protein
VARCGVRHCRGSWSAAADQYRTDADEQRPEDVVGSMGDDEPGPTDGSDQ